MIRNRIALLRAHAVQKRAYALAKGEDIGGLGTEAEPVICGARTDTVENRYKPHLFGIYGVKGLVDGSPTAKGLFTKGNGEKQMTDDMVMPLNTLKEFKNDVSSQWNGKARPGTMRHKIEGHFSTNDNGWFRSSVNKLFEFFPEKCPEDGKSYYKTWVQLANENPSGLLPAYFTDEKFSHKAKAGTASETGTKRAAQGGPKERKKPKKPREPKKPKNKAKKQPSGRTPTRGRRRRRRTTTATTATATTAAAATAAATMPTAAPRRGKWAPQALPPSRVTAGFQNCQREETKTRRRRRRGPSGPCSARRTASSPGMRRNT